MSLRSRLRKRLEGSDPRFRQLEFSSEKEFDPSLETLWAIGIEIEATYVLNPLDTKDSWDNVFDQIVTLDIKKVIEYVEKIQEKSNNKKYIYPDIEEGEKSGRKCRGLWVLKAEPWTSMLELMTHSPYGPLSFKKFGVDDVMYYSELLRERERNAIDQLNEIYYRDPYYGKKKKYRSIIPYPFSMTDRMVSADTLFGKKKQKPYANYTNSYHITITLPFDYSNVSEKEYQIMYQKYINQIQWIEPLLVAIYSTGDMRKIGSSKEYARGSMRIMTIGWGNPGGSDLRKFSEGLTRKANIPLYWRKGLNFVGQEKLEKICMDPKKLSEYRKNPHFPKSALYDIGGDIRTFTRSAPGNANKNLPTTKLFGIEIRIFDGFPTRYLSTLVRIIVYLAENSRRTPAKMLVYQNKNWIAAMGAIMRRGWRAELPKGYIDDMEKALDLKFPKKPLMANAFWNILLEQLYKRNREGSYVKTMLSHALAGDPAFDQKQIKIPKEKRKQPPLLSVNINRQAWDFGFLIRLQSEKDLCQKSVRFIQSLPVNKKMNLDDVFSFFKKQFSSEWDDSFNDVLHFFSLRDSMKAFHDKNGFLEFISLSPQQKKNGKAVVENRVGELVKLWPELLFRYKS